MAPPVGLEPTTPRLTAACSTDRAKEAYRRRQAPPKKCWRYLFFRPVSRQVSSAQVSLTSVFGMGTGGPSLQSTPTYFFLKEKVSKKNFTPFFSQEEGLQFNYHTLKTEQSNRRTQCKRLHSISSSQPETSGQALGLLVPVSSIHYCTSTSGLSTT